jgi:hypothetical protein
MKTRFVNINQRLRKSFLTSGSTLDESKTYFQEDVRPGAMLRNDPRYHKTPATWSYRVYRRIALNDFESDGAGHETYNSSGQKTYKGQGCFGIHVPDPLAADFDCRTAKNQALSRLNDQVRGSLDLSIALAEMGKTKEMIANCHKVETYAQRLRPPGGFPVPSGPARRIWNAANQASLAAANGYLCWKYGWKQLLSDVFNAADESARFTMNQLARFSASAKSTEARGSTYVTSVDGVPGVPLKIEGTAQLKAKYQIVLALPPSAFDIARWTSLNPVSLAWELIPYSFVIDWFVDIGSTLRNFETACYYNTQFRSGFVSTLSIHELEMKLAGGYYETQDAFGGKDKLHGLEGSSTVIDFNRTVLSSYPTPSLPKFKVDLGSSQLTSAASLLRQLLRRV